MKKLVILLLVVLVFACKEEDNVLSDKAEIEDFKVETSGNFTPDKIYLNTEEGKIKAYTNKDFEDSDFPVSFSPQISVSQGATVTPASGTQVNFSQPEDFVKYVVVSEDGNIVSEYIFTIGDRQIPNAGFENWFMETGMNGKPFQQPGAYGESTVWATANMGTSIYSIYGTSPVPEGDNTVVKIETVTTVALPLVAGALYVGEFDLDGAVEDPTNPVAAAKLGMPFYSRPKSVKFKYAFKAGEQMIQAVLKEPGNLFGGFDVFDVEGKDKFGIEIVLEKREGESITTIAKTNFQSDEDIETLTEIELPVNYLTNDEPTHFYISFSPSFDGGTFKGAIGSTLILDDVKLIYE